MQDHGRSTSVLNPPERTLERTLWSLNIANGILPPPLYCQAEENRFLPKHKDLRSREIILDTSKMARQILFELLQ